MIGMIVVAFGIRYRVLEWGENEFYGFPTGVADPVACWLDRHSIQRDDVPLLADVLREVS